MTAQNLGGSSDKKREDGDFYKTPKWATIAFLAREQFNGVVWEPACGDGAISKLLPEASISTDLYDRGFGEAGVDFLNTVKKVDHIVTNPPYVLAQRFAEHAFDCAAGKVALLLKLNFLAGQKRKLFFELHPPKTVYVYSKRLSFDRGNTPGKDNGILEYCWIVWERGFCGSPRIEWL